MGGGGTYRQITTALAAAAGGNVSAANTEFAKNMVVNYVQQQGAAYIGKLVKDDILKEGDPLHAAMHGIIACAGAAASNQSCTSGAAGAAASSLLTNLFAKTDPNETQSEREAKRNLITSIVAGIAATGVVPEAAPATAAATAAVDNNWLATKQIVQFEKELAAAKTQKERDAIEKERNDTSDRQDVLTAIGTGVGLGEVAVETTASLAKYIGKRSLPDPELQPFGKITDEYLDRINEISSKLSGDTETLKKLHQYLKDTPTSEIVNQLKTGAMDWAGYVKDSMMPLLQEGGDKNAFEFGRLYGKAAGQVGLVAEGGIGAAKGVINLGSAAIKGSKFVVDAAKGIGKAGSAEVKSGIKVSAKIGKEAAKVSESIRTGGLSAEEANIPFVEKTIKHRMP